MNQKLFPEQTKIPAIRIAGTVQNQNLGRRAVQHNVTDESLMFGVNLEKTLSGKFIHSAVDGFIQSLKRLIRFYQICITVIRSSIHFFEKPQVIPEKVN